MGTRNWVFVVLTFLKPYQCEERSKLFMLGNKGPIYKYEYFETDFKKIKASVSQ